MSGETVGALGAAPPPVTAVESLTAEQATAEIAATRTNPNHDWAHEGRAGHKAAAERMQQLYQRVHGGAAAPLAEIGDRLRAGRTRERRSGARAGSGARRTNAARCAARRYRAASVRAAHGRTGRATCG